MRKKKIYRTNIHWKSLSIREKAKTRFIKKKKCSFLKIVMTRLMQNCPLIGQRGRALKSQHTYLGHFIVSVKVTHAGMQECPYTWEQWNHLKELFLKVKRWYSTWPIWQNLPEHNSPYKNADSFLRWLKERAAKYSFKCINDWWITLKRKSHSRQNVYI